MDKDKKITVIGGTGFVDGEPVIEIGSRKLNTFTRKLNVRKTQNAEDIFNTTVKNETQNIKKESTKED